MGHICEKEMGGSAEADVNDTTDKGFDQTTAVATIPVPTRRKPKPKQLPPYKVLLHNDPVNDFDHVIKSIRRLTTLTQEDAITRTLEAHDTGLALLLVTHRERAELYVDQFASLSLTVTIEPDAG